MTLQIFLSRSLKILVFATGLIAVIGPATSFAQVSPGAMVVEHLLEKQLEMLLGYQAFDARLKSMNTLEGTQYVNQAYQTAVEKTNNYYNHQDQRVRRQMNEARSSHLLAKVRETNGAIRFIKNEFRIIARNRAWSLRNLSEERDQIVQEYSPYWRKNDKHPQKVLMM